uniref:SMCR8-C9orf72 complex subunit n=1 Tax=Leptobrachium leishanense TaxID=445787 RepID=A0A8C5PP88_9ANUR
MIGSPDVVAFTREEVYEEPLQGSPGLPEEYSVPLFPFQEADSSPWSRPPGAKFSKDFILISEFSEQVGPQPLLTIPDDPRVCGAFDLNYFSLRIMSVDYQASFVGHPPGSSYPKLNFVEDSKVVLGDSKEGAFAYVHHLTLYDLEARGFVRPFCMAYISADEDKIMQLFLELSGDFSKASDCLKTGNRKAFANELEKKLKDLEYTRSVLLAHLEEQRKTDGKGFYTTQAIDKANELANVEKSIIEHQDLLKQIQQYPYRKLKPEDDFQPFLPESPCDCTVTGEPERAAPSSDTEENPADEEASEYHPRASYTPKFIKAKSAKCFDKKMKTLKELVDVYFFVQTIDLLTRLERRYRGDVSYLLMRHLDQTLLEQQAISNFLFEDASTWNTKAFDRRYEEKLDASQSLHDSKYLEEEQDPVKPSASLESYKSSVESVPIKIEQDLFEENGHTEVLIQGDQVEVAEYLDVDIKGSISSGDSIEVLRTERSASMLSHSESQPCLRLHPSPQQLRRKHSGRRTISEDSIEVLSMCPSETIIPEDFRASYQIAINEEEPCVDEECEELTSGPDAAGRSETSVNELLIDPACCIRGDDSSPVQQNVDLSPDISVGDTIVSVPPQPCRLPDRNFQVKVCVDNAESPSMETACHRLSVTEPESVHLLSSREAKRMSSEEHLDSLSHKSSASTCSDRTPSPPPISSLSERHKRKAGQNALMFIRQYPFSHPAIYSLLSGRTLVVLGEEEAFVKRLVTALSIFVPNCGHSAKPIKPWATSPLNIVDFQKWKLIGLQRDASPPGSPITQSLSRYRRYASVLDADNKTLCCPVYKGSLLQRMADHRTQIRKGSTYYMHVQSMLTQLSSKAFLLTFCHHAQLRIHPDDVEESVCQRRAAFLHQLLGLSQDDRKIVEYLSELLKTHYVTEAGTQLLPALRFNYIPSILYKI